MVKDGGAIYWMISSVSQQHDRHLVNDLVYEQQNIMCMIDN